jgi:hypothetical protein
VFSFKPDPPSGFFFTNFLPQLFSQPNILYSAAELKALFAIGPLLLKKNEQKIELMLLLRL